MNSPTVAITFANETIGNNWGGVIISIFIILCTVGSILGTIYAGARLFFDGARRGFFHGTFGLVNPVKGTPIPAIIIFSVVTCLMIICFPVEFLISYSTFAEWIFLLSTVSGLLYMRWSQPNLHRPIKIHIIFPCIFVVSCSILIVTGFYYSPKTIGGLFISILLGFPVYSFTQWNNRPSCLMAIDQMILSFTQMICYSFSAKEIID